MSKQSVFSQMTYERVSGILVALYFIALVGYSLFALVLGKS
jgi:hypothetical protein